MLKLNDLRRLLSALLLAAMLAWPACQSTPEPDPGQPVRHENKPEAQRIDSHRLIPPDTARGIYETQGEGIDGQKRRAFKWQRVEDDPDTPGMQRWLMEIDEVSRTWVQRDAQGNWLMQTHEDMVENVRVEYEPGLLLIPAELVAGQTHEGQVEMEIFNLDDGSRRTGGTCVFRLTVGTPEHRQTSMGEHEVWPITATQTLNLTLARVRVEIQTEYAPELGQVRDQVDRSVRALGIFGSDERRLMKRVE